MHGQHYAQAAEHLGKTFYLLYPRLGEPQGQSGQAWKISSPLGFDTWSVQPIASCYTNYASHATVHDNKAGKTKGHGLPP
jgi:hypothetical protein